MPETREQLLVNQVFQSQDTRLEADLGGAEPVKRLKRESDHEDWTDGKGKSEGVQETASSQHGEETASLGKRSIAESTDLRLHGRPKAISHCLDSIEALESILVDFEYVLGREFETRTEVRTGEVRWSDKDDPDQAAAAFFTCRSDRETRYRTQHYFLTKFLHSRHSRQIQGNCRRLACT